MNFKGTSSTTTTIPVCLNLGVWDSTSNSCICKILNIKLFISLIFESHFFYINLGFKTTSGTYCETVKSCADLAAANFNDPPDCANYSVSTEFLKLICPIKFSCT